MPSPSSQALSAQNSSTEPSRTPDTRVVIGMIGLGTVGSGVFKIFRDHPDIFFQKILCILNKI